MTKSKEQWIKDIKNTLKTTGAYNSVLCINCQKEKIAPEFHGTTTPVCGKDCLIKLLDTL